MKLDCFTVATILRCFRTSACRKSRNRVKNKKFVVLAEYFEQQTNCSRYNWKMSQSRGQFLRGGISHIYLSVANKWKASLGAINSWPRNLRTALENYFQFQWICKHLQIEARTSMTNCDIYFPIFSETMHRVLKIFSKHDLRKVR